VSLFSGHGETSWCFSQVKGALNDDITDADVISCVEFNHDGDLLATGDKGGRVVIFQVRLKGDLGSAGAGKDNSEKSLKIRENIAET
jgi:hypothetical protein